MTDSEKIKQLAALIIGVNGNLEELTASELVHGVALYALIRTHPDPEAFAAAFRSAWRHGGEWHLDPEKSARIQAGIDRELSLVEGACRVPLELRSPEVAAKPDP